MEYITVYECESMNFLPWALICFAFVAFNALMIFVLYRWYNYKKKKGMAKPSNQIRTIAVAVGITLLTIVTICKFAIEIPQAKAKIYDRYVNNEVSIVNGKVEIELGDEEIQSISMSGIDFCLEANYHYSYNSEMEP